MDVPARIRIEAGIKTGSVYYFGEEQLSSLEPHYFIILNKNPRTDEFLILVCASSQVEKRKQIIKRLGFPQETLVFISPSEYPIFTKKTVVDCNRVFEKTIDSLVGKLEQGKLGVCTEVIEDQIVNKLIQGVMVSGQVSEQVKKMITSEPNN